MQSNKKGWVIMGTFYTLGVIHKFKATSNQPLTNKEWIKILNVRVDVSLFDLLITDVIVNGSLQSNIFKENIIGIYEILRGILGADRNPNLDYYEKEYGIDLDNYQMCRTSMNIQNEDGLNVRLDLTIALLFIEGKVFVEEFYSDPILINWLFRHSDIKNKLAGCIISNIVG